MMRTLRAAIFALFVVSGSTAPVLAAGPPRPPITDFTWLDGLSLIELRTGDIPSMHRARALIETEGGRVALMVPPSTLVGWVPRGSVSRLESAREIRSVRFSEVPPDGLNRFDPREKRVVGFFNRAVRGEIAERERRAVEAVAAARRSARGGDAREPGVPRMADVEANLRGVGVDLPLLKQRGIWNGPQQGTLGNSDNMTGTIALSVFFVESDGSGSDPDTYTWTEQDMQLYLDGVAGALAWWSNQASLRSGCSATFLLYYYSANDPVTHQWVEPILHDTSFESTWVNAIMQNLGYTSGGMFSRVGAFNTWQRSTYQTDRAYSAFVPYNPSPAAAQFPDGNTAYAWFFGPHTIVPFRVQGWTKTQVFAHESGHIFGACDEYTGGCSSCTGSCSHATPNGNCEACNAGSRDCMMKANTFNLCIYTPGQIGWEVVPCTPPPPPPLPAPTVAALNPSSALQGISATLTISGTNFFAGASVDMGPGVFVDKVTVNGSSSLTVDFTVYNTIAPGFYDVTVKNRDFQAATFTASLEVLPTRQHYFSPSGTNVFPYITPSTAATNIENAIAAAFNGDTLYVGTGTVTPSGPSLVIDRGVILQGAWNATFTSRDLAAGKTVINVQGNVEVFPGADGGGVDGFIIQNGTGSVDVTPFAGRYGGGVRILSTRATVANCEIRNCQASSMSSEEGFGGGIFASGADVDIRNNVIDGNSAAFGGGIYLYRCSGTVTGNTVSNHLLSGPTTTLEGAGINLFECDSIALASNTVSGNAGAMRGGGIIATRCNALTIDAGEVSHNTSTFAAAGISIRGGSATIRTVDILHNASPPLGGGIACEDSAAVTVDGCWFEGNAASVGGGILAQGGTAVITHNLFVENQATSGGAVNASSLVGGRISSNTFDRNISSTGAGGIQISVSPVPVFNNLIANSSGDGISCGGSLPTLSYNLVNGSSGADWNGCVPGPGSGTWAPLFVDTASGDYHLGVNSGAIDAGDPSPARQDADGSRGDMGRFGAGYVPVSQPPPPTGLGAVPAAGNITLTWNRSTAADVASYAVYADSAAGFTPGSGSFVIQVSDTSVVLPAPADTVVYRVNAIDSTGYAGGYSAEASVNPVTAVGGVPVVYVTRLYPNVPNPFNPSTAIRFELAARENVRLNVYDVSGRSVRRLVDGERGVGVHTVVWNGRDEAGRRVASGVYFYRLVTPFVRQTRKMVLLK